MESTTNIRTHPPLRRVSRGRKVSVNSGDQPRIVLYNGNSCDGWPSQDSCYSSCSDESSQHGVLSRETSDTLIREQSPESDKIFCHFDALLDFALKLGYNEQQLAKVVADLETDTDVVICRDRCLAELVKLAGKSTADSKSTPMTREMRSKQLRAVIVDGSNLAMTHGRNEIFSCSGIGDCVDFFRRRGHTDIKVFVPQFRRESSLSDCPIIDQHVLFDLAKEGVLIWTPSRMVSDRRIVCHDDRYVVGTAHDKDGIIVSNDEYRQLIGEEPKIRKVVQDRLLMYSFVNGRFVPPNDPLGKYGPKLGQFLSKRGPIWTAQLCPYGWKCTYGNKCKYFHPERPGGVHVTFIERLLMENDRKKCLSAYTSNIYFDNGNKSQQLDHPILDRTQSLTNQHQLTDCRPQVNQRQITFNQRHRSLNCHQSEPWKKTTEHSVDTNNINTAHNLFENDHLFVPSTAVWGQSELSVAPIFIERIDGNDLNNLDEFV